MKKLISVIAAIAIVIFCFTACEKDDNPNEQPNSYQIKASANPAEGGIITGAGTYNLSDTATLVATANPDYTFQNWTENGTVVSTETTYSFEVTGARTLVANFQNGQPNSYQIKASANPAEGGIITGAGTYNLSDTATLVATANPDYTFQNWTENGTVISTETTYSFEVTGARTLVANFQINGNLVNDGVYNPARKISKIYHKDEDSEKYLEELWTWNGDLLQKIDYYDDDGEFDGTANFTYDDQNRIKRVDKVEEYGNENEYTVYEYNGNHFAKAIQYDYEDGIYCTEEWVFSYNDNNKISRIEITETCPSLPPKKSIINLEWSGGNIIKINGVDFDGYGNPEHTWVDTYRYDNKINPFNGFFGLDLKDSGLYQTYNNVVGGTVTLEGIVYPIHFSYTYDGEFPITKRFEDEVYYYEYK